MFFKYDKRKPLITPYKTLNVGDMFRFRDTVYIKLNGSSALNIYTDEIIELTMCGTEVELLDYDIIIYAEEE